MDWLISCISPILHNSENQHDISKDIHISFQQHSQQRCSQWHNRCKPSPFREHPRANHKGASVEKFLTVDEIKALMDTPCPVMSRPQVKQAFMLSIFTYLSSADVLSLKWKDIKTIEGRTTIEVHSRKSSVPLTAVSMRWLPETTNHRGLVFKGLPKDTEIRNILLKWAKCRVGAAVEF